MPKSLSECFQKNQIILGYYPLRGKVQVCRLLCEYLHLSYMDLFFIPSTWQQFKNTHRPKLNSKDLPILIDGSLVVGESYPMCLWIVNKANRMEMLGKTIEDQLHIDMLLWENQAAFQIVLSPQMMNNLSDQFIKYWNPIIKQKVEEIERKCHENTFLGYLSIADFFIYEFCHYVKETKANKYIDLQNNFPRIFRIYNHVFSLPEIRNYESSKKAVKTISAIQFCQQWKQKCLRQAQLKKQH